MKYGLALGSNLGDRRENLIEARRRLFERTTDPSSLLCASLYETAPVDCDPDAPPFLNTCLELDFDLTPRVLRAFTQSIETDLGRPELHPTNAPRSIDIDILYAGNEQISETHLEIPHPRLTQRRFVLVPLNDIQPNLILPGQSDLISSLLKNLQSDEPPLALAAQEW